MNSGKAEVNAVSTFAQRFEYARARQHALGTWREDSALAEHLGIAASQITDYKSRDEAPPARRTLAIAAWCDVDPGWLAFGEASQAPEPEGFAAWLVNRARTSAAANASAPRDTGPTGRAALAQAVQRTADRSELERKDIPAKRPKRRGA